MPANFSNQSVYTFTGNPATMNVSSLYKPGELGQRIIDTNGNGWQLVQLDSGATSATSVGVVAAGQVAYWKDRTNYIVTNDSNQCLTAVGNPAQANSEFRNYPAGVFGVAATAGNYCFVQQRGRANVKAAAGGTYTIGNYAVCNTGTAADITTVAVGTAPTVLSIGLVAGARSAPNAPVDLALEQPDIP